ncbi:MAG: class I SAM-dependent methyltransferase [Ferruginibacter sp.]
MIDTTGAYPVADEFEQLYISLRQKEGRIYKDEEVASLPFIHRDHPNAKEWEIRARTFKKILSHIKRKDTGLNILEVGCGNGWLSAQLAAASTGTVIGIDINNTELEQAKRVFRKHSNLRFIYGDLRNAVLGNTKFDIILFAASIQYFSSLKEVTDTALKYLATGGEMHILDSHFYRQKEIAAAKQRSSEYYSSIGFSELAMYYHHHSIEALNEYQHIILEDPYSWKNKLSVRKYPFHWVLIKNK